MAALVYFSDDLIERLVSPEVPDGAAIAAAVESAYVRIGPAGVTTSSIDLDGRLIRYDYVMLSRKGSLLRANLEVTRAVEKAGGGVMYGIESFDEPKRRQFLTLGISSGGSLMCEVRLEKRLR